VPGIYSYVDGATLGRFLLDVRDEFWMRLPHDDDHVRRPNSIRLVAIDVLEGKTSAERLSILSELIDANPELIVLREDDRDIFEYSDTPAAYVTDLICEVTRQILVRDPTLRDEDGRRLARAIRPIGRT
jgi:hypothetical protein